jgi:hypothetical protein
MDAETAKALEDSIAHWKRMREDPECGEKPYGSDCALCAKFRPERCEGCPVDDEGDGMCNGTPWDEASWAWHITTLDPGPIDPVSMVEWHEAADAEIAFLEGLREE